MMQDEQQKAPIEPYERDLVLPPDEMLRQRRDRLIEAINATDQQLDRSRAELARIEERDRLLHAALADLDAAIRRLHLKPIQPEPMRNAPRQHRKTAPDH